MKKLRFSNKYAKVLEKDSLKVRNMFKKGFEYFLETLSANIVACSPVSEGSAVGESAPHSVNNFVHHTYIYADNDAVKIPKEPRRAYKHPYSSINGLHNVLSRIRVGTRGRRGTSWSRVPKKITVVNESYGADGKFKYSDNVIRDGWKKTPPYQPFARAWMLTANNPTLRTFMEGMMLWKSSTPKGM